MIKELAAAPWSREAPASEAQSSLFSFWHRAGLLMFISPCLLFLTLFRMFFPAGEGEASQWGEHEARTLALLPPRVYVRAGRLTARPAWPPHGQIEKLRPEIGRDLPKTMSKFNAEDFPQR